MSRTPKTCDGYRVAEGKLAVTVCNCCDRVQYCIDVAELNDHGHVIDNDHDSAGILVSAGESEIESYLTAALDKAAELYAQQQHVRRTAVAAAAAGVAAIDQQSGTSAD